MAVELKCLSCEGELAWAGAQVSCRGCGKVYTMAGKPGSKLGVLIVGVGIGAILGFIGAYELNRFVLHASTSSSLESEASPQDAGSAPTPLTPAESKPPS